MNKLVDIYSTNKTLIEYIKNLIHQYRVNRVAKNASNQQLWIFCTIMISIYINCCLNNTTIRSPFMKVRDKYKI